MKRIFVFLLVVSLLASLISCGSESEPEQTVVTDTVESGASSEENALKGALSGVWMGKGAKDDFYFASVENKLYFFSKTQLIQALNQYFDDAMKQEGADAYNKSYAKKTLPAMNFPEFALLESPKIKPESQSVSFSDGEVILLADGPVYTGGIEMQLKLEKIASDFSPQGSIASLFEEAKSLCTFSVEKDLPTPKEYAEKLLKLMMFSNISWTTASNNGNEVIMTDTGSSTQYNYYLKYNETELELKYEGYEQYPNGRLAKNISIHYSGTSLFVGSRNFYYNAVQECFAAFIQGLPGELSSTVLAEKFSQDSSFQHGPFSYSLLSIPFPGGQDLEEQGVLSLI